jgi:hypothetical protein
MPRPLIHLDKKIILNNLKYQKASIVSIVAKIQDKIAILGNLQELVRGSKI